MPLRSAGEREPRVEEPGDIPGRWLLPAGNGTVAQTRTDYAFTLVLWSRTSPLRTGTPFSYGPAGETRRFVPSAAPGPAPPPCLHQATVTSAETGRLTMAFADGGERYEAFTVTGFLPAVRRGFSFAALTRGGLSRW